jgi:hypothetical protein
MLLHDLVCALHRARRVRWGDGCDSVSGRSDAGFEKGPHYDREASRLVLANGAVLAGELADEAGQQSAGPASVSSRCTGPWAMLPSS